MADLVGFKVKIKDGNGTHGKYIEHDKALATSTSDTFDTFLSYTEGAVTYYFNVDTNGSLVVGTTSASWTLDENNRLTIRANDETYWLIHADTAVDVQVTEPASGHTVETE